MWLIGLGTIAFALYQANPLNIRVDKRDLWALLLLVFLFAPVYVVGLGWLPQQLTFDELSLIVYGERQSSLDRATHLSALAALPNGIILRC